MRLLLFQNSNFVSLLKKSKGSVCDTIDSVGLGKTAAAACVFRIENKFSFLADCWVATCVVVVVVAVLPLVVVVVVRDVKNFQKGRNSYMLFFFFLFFSIFSLCVSCFVIDGVDF